MELKEAIEWLKEYAEWVNRLNTQHPDTMGVAIDTVLTELDRLQKAKEEMTAEEFLDIRDMECIKYDDCDDKCKFRKMGECVALCRIAIQIAKEIKEGKDGIK